MQNRWLFPDPPNTAVITTTRIAYNHEAVLRVIHHDGWQFLDDKDVAMRDAAVVGLQEMIVKDNSLAQLADLPDGWQAWRDTPHSPWKRSLL